MILIGKEEVHPSVLDEKNRGLCHAARTHCFVFRARSAWSHKSCSEPALKGT